MKTTFFSIIALAVSALAVPIVQDAAPKTAITRDDSHVSNNEEFIGSLKGAASTIHDINWSLNYIVNKYTDGKISKEDAADESIPELKNLESALTGISDKLTGATGINITGVADIKAVLDITVDLSSTVLVSIKTIVGAIGPQPNIKVIVKAVCKILSKVLILTAGLVSAIVPGLNEALRPIISEIGQGILSPLVATATGSIDEIVSSLGI